MVEFITGLLSELSILAGITMFIMGFFEKFKEYKVKMITIGVILIIIGVAFFDTAGISEAYHKGFEYGNNN